MQRSITAYADTHALTIQDALRHAHDAGLSIGKYADPIEGAQADIGVGLASAVAAEDPSLIYVEE